MGAGVTFSIAASALVALIIGLFFGTAFGVWYAEPRFKNAHLHEGKWGLVGMQGRMVTWQRKEPRRDDCDDGHRAYVCTIVDTTEHVDACDCGATREGVFGRWS